MSTGRWIDLLGTLKNQISVGLAGFMLKNSSGNILARNAGDSADVEITASKINISGNDAVINSDSAGSGADWNITLRRPSTGMTADWVWTFPPDNGSPGYVLKTDGSGVSTWEAETGGGGGASNVALVDATALAFGDSSPVAMFNVPADNTIDLIEVIIDTAFNGTAPQLSIGISGTTSKYMGTGDINLKAVAGTIFEVKPGLAAQGAESLIATYVADSSSAGAARIRVTYGEAS